MSIKGQAPKTGRIIKEDDSTISKRKDISKTSKQYWWRQRSYISVLSYIHVGGKL